MAGSIESQKLMVIAELDALREETARDIESLRTSATGLKHSVVGWPLRHITRRVVFSTVGALASWFLLRKVPRPVASMILGMSTARTVLSRLINH